MNMFVVRNIDIVEVSDIISYINFYEFQDTPFHPVKPEEHEIKITREMVVGKVFKNERNERICIGMTSQVQKTLGISFEAIDNMRKQIDLQNETINKLQEKIYNLENMTLIEKIIVIFKKHNPMEK